MIPQVRQLIVNSCWMIQDWLESWLLSLQAGVKMKELAQMAGEPIQKGRKRKLWRLVFPNVSFRERDHVRNIYFIYPLLAFLPTVSAIMAHVRLIINQWMVDCPNGRTQTGIKVSGRLLGVVIFTRSAMHNAQGQKDWYHVEATVVNWKPSLEHVWDWQFPNKENLS